MPFELGRPLGAPNEPEFQRRVLEDTLDLLTRPSGPVLEDFPDPPPGDGAASEDDTEGWACPVNFAPPVDDLDDAEIVREALMQEINLLRPWYEEAVRTYKRSAFGISESSLEDIAQTIADVLVDPAGTAPPIEGIPLGDGFKRRADDLRYFYTEAAIAKPGPRISDLDVANWLWGETTLGKVLVAIRNASMESDDPSLKALAPIAMVPLHQRHRTRHG